MAVITYPSVTSKEYAGDVTEVRAELNEWARIVERSPASATDIKAQVLAFMAHLGWTTP